MSAYDYPVRMRRNLEKPGWYWVEFKEPDHYDDPAPGEYYWLALSPKLRLFDAPGYSARGQLSKADFRSLEKEAEQVTKNLLPDNQTINDVAKELGEMYKVTVTDQNGVTKTYITDSVTINVVDVD